MLAYNMQSSGFRKPNQKNKRVMNLRDDVMGRGGTAKELKC